MRADSRTPPQLSPDDAAPGFALTAKGRHGMEIVMADDAAERHGIHAGQTLTHARAILPGLVTAPAEPHRDARLLRQLAGWCLRYAPWTNVDGEDGLWIDATGSTHLFGDEADMVADLGRRLTAMGFENRIGLAETPGAAWAMARFATRPADGNDGGAKTARIVAAGGLEAALAPLPVEALRLDDAALAVLLRRLGIETIGTLAGLPRASLARRFPARRDCESVLARLDQAMGRLAEPVSPIAPAPAYRARAGFAEPILATESFSLVLERLLEELEGLLEKHGMGARRMSFTACHCDGGTSRIAIATARPSRDRDHLARLFAERLDRIDPGYGVDAAILAADVVQPLAPGQSAFTQAAQPQGDPATFGRLIDRLSNRLGPEAVYRPAARESHLPERAVAVTPPGGPAEWTPGPEGLPSRPLRLLDPPEAIEAVAEIPDGPPMMFRWRRVARRVVHARGPERICPEWWRDLGSRERIRDYYEVEDERGRRYWIFREGLYQDPGAKGPPLWRLHGLFA